MDGCSETKRHLKRSQKTNKTVLIKTFFNFNVNKFVYKSWTIFPTIYYHNFLNLKSLTFLSYIYHCTKFSGSCDFWCNSLPDETLSTRSRCFPFGIIQYSLLKLVSEGWKITGGVEHCLDQIYLSDTNKLSLLKKLYFIEFF